MVPSARVRGRCWRRRPNCARGWRPIRSTFSCAGMRLAGGGPRGARGVRRRRTGRSRFSGERHGRRECRIASRPWRAGDELLHDQSTLRACRNAAVYVAEQCGARVVERTFPFRWRARRGSSRRCWRASRRARAGDVRPRDQSDRAGVSGRTARSRIGGAGRRFAR